MNKTETLTGTLEQDNLELDRGEPIQDLSFGKKNLFCRH